MDSEVSPGDEDSGLLADVIPDRKPSVEYLVAADQYEDRVFTLIETVGDEFKRAGKTGERNAQIWFEFVYGRIFNCEITQREVSQKYGISQSYASRIYNRGLRRLRVLMDREDMDLETLRTV